jgi:NitT/TauT family transport system permease protein
LVESSVETAVTTTPSSRERPRGARFRRGLTGVLLFLLIGETVSRTGLVNSRYLPPPSIILARAARLVADPGFLRDVAFTLTGWATGLLIAGG